MKSKTVKDFFNSFFGRIILMVLIGMTLIAVSVSVVVIGMSKDIFTRTYGSSQTRVFDQINEDLDLLYERLQKVCEAIDESWAFRVYLSDTGETDNIQTFLNTYQMEQDLDASKSLDLERLNILVVGMNGKHYLSRTETMSMSDEEILASEAARRAIETPELLQFTYSHGAYTSTSKNTDVLIVSKALYYKESKQTYGVVFITLTMADLKKYYDYFVTDNTAFYMVNSDDVVMCSSEESLVGQALSDKWYEYAISSEDTLMTDKIDGKYLTIMKQGLSYYDSSIIGIIDDEKALDELYNIPTLILICAAIGSVVLAVCLLFTRQTIVPLSELVDKMSKSRDENFTEKMPEVGTVEVQELAVTYNRMLSDISRYIDEVLNAQKMQRTAEIKALQMQINPHYIYNTLAGIKWLVYQNDAQKTVRTIDAFIELLRNTISNDDEYITIRQELTNIKNYILIHQTRYDNQIMVEYYISENCYSCLLPKMILQPFIENAFFHAFPSGRRGTIQIYMRKKEIAASGAEQSADDSTKENSSDVSSVLEIEISDDGVGMDEDAAEKNLTQETKSEHFSGIGIHNVQERMKLLYGDDYGVKIESSKGGGTTVKICLPAKIAEGRDELI